MTGPGAKSKVSTLAPNSRLTVDKAQVAVCRPVEDTPQPVEPRAVTRAVPGLLGVVPGDDAAQVRTDRRACVQVPLLIAVSGHLRQDAPEHGARARPDFLDGADIAARQPVSILPGDAEVLPGELARGPE